MVASIPADLLETWLQDLRSILIADARKTKNNLMLNEGMLHGLDQVQHRMETWRCHRENMEALARSGKQFLITKDVNLSRGRYKKLEWYEKDQFITLAWRHARNAKTGELMLEIQDIQRLSNTFLLYEGNLNFEALAGLARKGGLKAIKNEEDWRRWD